MESNFLTTVFLPLALFIIMLGMGLGLKVDDFKRILIEPFAVFVGLIAQLIMLPIVGFLVATIFPLTPELAVGVMILSACPGGATSNLVTYLVRGNVALSITLTAISSLVTVFSIPLVVNLAMQHFMEANSSVQLPFIKTVIQIAVITIIPVVSGMGIHYYFPLFAAQVEKWVKWLSLFFLALIIFGLVLKEKANIPTFFLQVGGVTLVLNILTMVLAYLFAVFSKLTSGNAKAITVEVGIQNSTLAIAIASSPTLLNNPTMAIPAAIYSLIMFATSAAFAWLVNREIKNIPHQ
ncbi:MULTISPECIES: bile acid:sodium symporter family protein [Aphanizomenonaceae]|uniref:Bile acid:sodium symporter family protein n=1 Tax=Dolichospermum heterosporum TAC447 TaxID=747523 RepID=A0ABY5M1T7_9CYAN|nr:MULTISPECIES: bile acid:sodium symporter family protein [Aphanizomenonaceae]MBE9257734.1 bile acid:sodium symporter family protein [Dolichospermum sp. LEGE 00246]UUO17022.1 bile acid:sodium symporter family protein [Dolichospermum heterosporum TAC447]